MDLHYRESSCVKKVFLYFTLANGWLLFSCAMLDCAMAVVPSSQLMERIPKANRRNRIRAGARVPHWGLHRDGKVATVKDQYLGNDIPV